MSSLSPSASIEAFFEFLEYCSSMLEVDPETSDLQAVLTGPANKLAKSVADKTLALRAVNRTTALRDYQFRGMNKAVATFERKASGEFEKGEKDPGYLRLFPKTPAQLARTSIEDRAKVFGDFLDDVQSDETPKALERPGKAVGASWSGYEGAIKRFAAAQGALGKERDKVDRARREILVAIRKLEGKLTDRFADDARRAGSYFPPSKPVRKKAAKPPPKDGTPPGTTTTTAAT